MLPMDDQREVNDRVIPAGHFWMECAVNSCRARGPIRGTLEEAERAAKAAVNFQDRTSRASLL